MKCKCKGQVCNFVQTNWENIVTCRLVYTLHGNIRIYSHRADMQTEHQTKLFVKMNNSSICQCVFWQIQFAKKITSFPVKQTLNI